jgi:hypothetical protein
MAKLLRKIRKSRWYKNELPPWLPQGSLQADPLSDLNTQDNSLSLWQIQANNSNLTDIVLALATTLQSISNIDCAIFDSSLISEINCKIEQKEGRTCYQEASKWHCDVVELTADKLLQLAKLIYDRAERKRFRETDVETLLINAVNLGKISLTSLQPNVKDRILSK